ncbi:MAG: ATP-binding protein, partial [Cyclobacteriaceae bacterium]|nr:ATP-binding protein [Cyclobacteriaceae bacterium]
SEWNSINVIYKGRKSEIWAGTNRGLIRYDSLKDDFQYYPLDTVEGVLGEIQKLPHADVNSIYQIDDNHILIGTWWEGIILFDIQTEKFHQLAKPSTHSDSLWVKKVKQITYYNNKYWFLSEEQGLESLSSLPEKLGGSQGIVEKFPIEGVSRSLDIDKKGSFWVASSSGLYKLNVNDHKISRFGKDEVYEMGLSSDICSYVFNDSKNNLWVGHRFEGVDVGNPYNPLKHYGHIKNTENSLPDDYVVAFFEDDKNNIWVGYYNSGTYYIDENQNVVHDLKNGFIKNIFLAFDLSDGTKGFAGKEGIYLYDELKMQFDYLPMGFSITVDRDKTGNLWAVGNKPRGFYRFETLSKAKTFFSFSDLGVEESELFCSYKLKNGHILYGGKNKVIDFDPDKKQATTFTFDPKKPEKFPNGSIYDIIEDSHSNIWLATDNGLIYTNEPGTYYKSITTQEGLSNNTVWSVLEDKNGKIWIVTNRGIDVVDPETFKVRHLGVPEGVQSNEFIRGAKLIDSKGYLYLGGVNGYNRVHTDSLNYIDAGNEGVRITKFLLNNSEVKPGKSEIFDEAIYLEKEINLQYNDYPFAFMFTSLNFINPEGVKFRYRLEGFNENWTETDATDRRAVFTNVPPGSYVFQVTNTHKGEEWSDDIAMIIVNIAPPWWLTNWAKFLWALLALGVPAGFYFLRVSALERTKKSLEKEVVVRTEQINNQKKEIELQALELKENNKKLIELANFKEEMTSMIVHDLKTPLSALISEHESGNSQANKIGKEMLTMVLNILDVYRYENQSMNLKVSLNDFGEVVKAARDEVLHLAKKKNISVISDLKQVFSIELDKEVIIRVLVNLLTNAVKYSPLNSSIIIDFQKLDTGFKVMVIDQGDGLPDSEKEKVFDKFYQFQAQDFGNVRSSGIGLTFCKMAIEAHKGQIGVNSEQGKGSTFWFTLPGDLKEMRKVDQETRSSEFQLDNVQKDWTQLSPIIEKISSLEIYEISELLSVLNDFQPPQNSELEYWKEEIILAVRSFNNERFEFLKKIN